nr:hypothetical protein [Tanacetum cinerariifolium]
MSSVRTPQQNGVVKRRNQTDCYCVFHSKPLHYSPSFHKTPYELINGRKLDISFLHVFGALCYPKNDREDIGKLGAKGDIGFFIGYSADSCAYKIYNRRTKKIMDTINVSFDELSAMAFEQRSLKPGLQSMTSGQISLELDLIYAPSTITKQQPIEGELDLLFEAMYDDYFGGQPYVNDKNSRGKKQKTKVSFKENQMKYQPKVTKPKKVERHKTLATPKPRKSRLLLRWSPTGKLFDNEGKIVDSSESKSQLDCSNGDNPCTSNILEPKIKQFPNSTSLLDRLFRFVYEVAFRRDACFVRNLEGVDLLNGDRSTTLYTINLHEMASASPICLIARASSTKSWLWHQRLSHLNFDTINDLARNDLVAGLPKFKYHKEHLCPSCEQEKSKRASHQPKPVPNSRQRLHLLYMDLCGPMRIASINGKRYVLVIVDDYSRYTWVHFLRSKDEAPENQVLKEYFDTVGISHHMSSVRTPQQNGVVERRNRTLVDATRTMLIFSRAPLFLWAEAIATACFTQNRSIIHHRFNKTPYELINGTKPDISFLHVFGAMCYPKNDHEDIGKLGAKGDIGFFIGYSADSCAYRVYNLQNPLNSMTFGQISSGLDLLFEAMYDDYIGGQPLATARTVLPVQEPQVRQSSTASTTIADTALIPANSSSHATNIPITSHDVDELNPNAMVDGNTFVNPFKNSSTSAAASSLPQNVDPSNMHTFYQPYPHEFQWTKDHPLEQVIEEPSRPILTRNQLRSDGDMCMYALIGFIDTDHPSHVYKLKKALYGLKQVPRAWYDELSNFLLQNHFFKGTIDPTLFIRCFQDNVLVVQVYVDDIIFGSTHPRYTKDSGFELTGFSDADYAGCKDTFESTSGGAQFSREKLVSWSSKKQDCTALSTVEAEYVSL